MTMNQAFASGKYFSPEIAGYYTWSEFQELLRPLSNFKPGPRPWCATPTVKHIDVPDGLTERDFLLRLGGEQEVRKNPFTPFEVAAVVENEKSNLLDDEQGNHFFVLGVCDQLFLVSPSLRSNDRSVAIQLYRGHTLHLGTSRIFRKVN